MVRPETWLVAGLASVLASASDPSLPGAVSLHLLLLSRRVLQGVLGRPTVLCGRRAAQVVPRGALVSAHHAEHPPLLPLCRGAVPVRARLRCLEGDVVHGRRRK